MGSVVEHKDLRREAVVLRKSERCNIFCFMLWRSMIVHLYVVVVRGEHGRVGRVSGKTSTQPNIIGL